MLRAYQSLSLCGAFCVCWARSSSTADAAATLAAARCRFPVPFWLARTRVPRARLAVPATLCMCSVSPLRVGGGVRYLVVAFHLNRQPHSIADSKGVAMGAACRRCGWSATHTAPAPLAPIVTYATLPSRALLPSGSASTSVATKERP